MSVPEIFLKHCGCEPEVKPHPQILDDIKDLKFPTNLRCYRNM